MQKQIEVFDKNNNSLGIFKTIDELIKQSEGKFGTKFAKNGIYWACSGKTKDYKGFIFKYVNVKIEIIKGTNSLGIFNGVYDIEYSSEKLFGVKLYSSAIRNVCEGVKQDHKGFIFRYVVETESAVASNKEELSGTKAKVYKIEKQTYERKVFLDNLPRWGKEAVLGNKGTINWSKSIGYKVPFVYDNIKGEIKIINYNSKTRKISLQYLDNPIQKIRLHNFVAGMISKVLSKTGKRINLKYMKEKENYTREIFLDNLPKRKDGNIIWKYSIGHKFKFVYDNIEEFIYF